MEWTHPELLVTLAGKQNFLFSAKKKKEKKRNFIFPVNFANVVEEDPSRFNNKTHRYRSRSCAWRDAKRRKNGLPLVTHVPNRASSSPSRLEISCTAFLNHAPFVVKWARRSKLLFSPSFAIKRGKKGGRKGESYWFFRKFSSRWWFAAKFLMGRKNLFRNFSGENEREGGESFVTAWYSLESALEVKWFACVWCVQVGEPANSGVLRFSMR